MSAVDQTPQDHVEAADQTESARDVGRRPNATRLIGRPGLAAVRRSLREMAAIARKPPPREGG